MLARFACADAALARLVLGCGWLCLLPGSCRCFLCLLTVCHLQVNRCVNAPPTRLPILVPFAFSRLCLRLASALCPFHFVLHDSGRADLPTFPCVTNCRANGLGRATSRLFTVWDCLTCTGCIPCRWASIPLHDIQPSHTRLTKSFAQVLPCLFRLLVLSLTADRLETDAP